MLSRRTLRLAGGVTAALLLVAGIAVAGRAVAGRAARRDPDSRMADIQHETNAPLVDHVRALKTVAVPTIVKTDMEASAPASSPQGAFAFETQRLIRTGRMTLEVTAVEPAVARLERLAAELGGYLTSSGIERHPDGSLQAEVTLRLPADRYQQAGASLRGLGKVLAESTSIEDVTKTYADLEAHLKVKREAERRVRDLLAQRAGSLKDVLEAEKELARIRGEVDTLEGERRWYAHQVRYSTLSLQLQEPVPLALSRPSAWSALGEALRDSAGILAGSLSTLLRGLLYLLPWALVLALAFGLVRWFRRKTMAEPRSA